ncbi:MAG TPA: M48 family metalloprotease [Candidatus Lokiarchaeia archaeon]|nr:M48 family metalloprotease [Candidatus Lokiarchaeia archaeon]
MAKASRLALFITILVVMVAVLAALFVFQVITWVYVVSSPAAWLFLVGLIWGFSEMWNWTKVGKRGEMADLSLILVLGAFFYLITSDFFTALLGAFGVYLFIGMFELKEYPVINKLGLITAIVYNVIFVMGLLDKFLPLKGFSYRDTAFGFSFWLILILGFAFFGRKYLVVWRFMSPQYLSLGLYLIAWLAVAYVSRWVQPDFYGYIYEVLIVTSFIVYFVSGPTLGFIMGIKRNSDQDLTALVQEVADQMGLKGKIKVGIGNYPIINAMAYGAFFDKRMGIICEDWRSIPPNELQGIIAHELAHLRGNHTLILTLISALTLIVQQLLNIPATFYDYTFVPGLSTRFPLIYYILVNILIFIILYVFVRILEGKADRAVRDIGRGPDLAKALYNLEGFYAFGREIGLNTMLLCDEKILPENKKMDYFNTAQYISDYLIRPSRGSLLSNLLNSHPPSPIRIASMFDTSFGPFAEAIMNFTLLRQKSRERFGRAMEDPRREFELQTTAQFLRQFQEDSVVSLCDSIGLREDFHLIVGKQHLLTHKIDGTLRFGVIDSIKYEENVGMPTTLVISESNGDVTEVPAELYDHELVQVGGRYDLKNHGCVTLESISLSEDQMDATFTFTMLDNSTFKLAKKDVKLPLPLDYLDDLAGKHIFLQKHGTYENFSCTHVDPGPSFKEYRFTVTRLGQDQEEIWEGKDLVVFPRYFGMPMHNDKTLWAHQLATFQYLQENQNRVLFSLKKPVNNEERGVITRISPGEGSESAVITIRNIHGIMREIPLKQVDFVAFSGETAAFELTRDLSFATKLLHKIIQRFRPTHAFM